jgi:hypothetical protein
LKRLTIKRVRAYAELKAVPLGWVVTPCDRDPAITRAIMNERVMERKVHKWRGGEVEVEGVYPPPM